MFWCDIKFPPFIWFHNHAPCVHLHFYVHVHSGHWKDWPRNTAVGGKKPVTLGFLLMCPWLLPGTLQIQKVMTVMISDHADLFPPSKDVLPSPPTQQNDKKAPIPRSSVGWDAAEDIIVPRADSLIQRQTVKVEFWRIKHECNKWLTDDYGI